MTAAGPRALALEPIEQDMLDGGHGPAPALAMRMVVELARAMAAPRLVPVTCAHIDGCLYHGLAGLDFARRLAELDGRVAVPTTLNVTSIDTLHPGLVDLPADQVRAAKDLAQAYIRLGAAPTFTCAPYLLVRPAAGEQVAWAESNAIVFANSVLGARTNRYGDFIDICAALTGRVPAAGLHLAQNRLAEVVIEVEVPAHLLAHDAGWAALGCAIGERVGGRIPAIVGVDAELASEDRLKALGAAAASAGSLALFHLIGRTPEAATLAEAAGGAERAGALPRIRLGASDLAAARSGLSTLVAGEPIDAVALGTPHFSPSEFTELDDALGASGSGPGGAGPGLRVPIWVTTSRQVLSDLDPVVAQRLRDRGVRIAVDTCSYLTPMLGGARRVVTSSAKWAWYAPANLGVQVALATLAECVASARSGRLVLDDAIWASGHSGRAGVAASDEGACRAAVPVAIAGQGSASSGANAIVQDADSPATRAIAQGPASSPKAAGAIGDSAPATTTLPARILAPGPASGELLVLDQPLSLWGGTEVGTGRISDIHHPQCGLDLAGKIVAMPASRGSSSSASVLAEAIRAGHAPGAIVLGEVDALLVMGTLVTRELYDTGIPILVADVAAIRRAEATCATIDAETDPATVTLTRNGST